MGSCCIDDYRSCNRNLDYRSATFNSDFAQFLGLDERDSLGRYEGPPKAF